MVYSPANKWEKKEITKGLKRLVDGGAGKKVYKGFYRNSVEVRFGRKLPLGLRPKASNTVKPLLGLKCILARG
jgi:hypothetical protein